MNKWYNPLISYNKIRKKFHYAYSVHPVKSSYSDQAPNLSKGLQPLESGFWGIMEAYG